MTHCWYLSFNSNHTIVLVPMKSHSGIWPNRTLPGHSRHQLNPRHVHKSLEIIAFYYWWTRCNLVEHPVSVDTVPFPDNIIEYLKWTHLLTPLGNHLILRRFFWRILKINALIDIEKVCPGVANKGAHSTLISRKHNAPARHINIIVSCKYRLQNVNHLVLAWVC